MTENTEDPAFCFATLQESRLLAESLQVNEALAPIFIAMPKHPLVQAHTEITNNVSISFHNREATGLEIRCAVKVRVGHEESSSGAVISYTSTYVAIFKVESAVGLLPEGDAPLELLAPYIALANWLAVCRADGGISATGIANMRLKVPISSVGSLQATHISTSRSHAHENLH